MATFTAGVIGIDFDILDISGLVAGAVSGATDTSRTIVAGGVTTVLTGAGFDVAGAGPPSTGVIAKLAVSGSFGSAYTIQGLSLAASSFRAFALTADNPALKAALFGGGDSMTGSGLDDRLRGLAGDDTLVGGAGADFLDGGDGADSVTGGLGNDTVVDSTGVNYLRGDEGDDLIVGGVEFDDANGNMGNDTVSTGAGEDYCVGGKDNDSLDGGADYDLVYGNLGDDTCDGGDGNDIVRGGQGNDLCFGGSGDDFVSGDKGDDTMTGGAGADVFHTFGDAGIDRVTDFSLAQGDRVQLDPGTVFTVSQVGADTVINMTGGGQMTLVGIQMSSLTGNWIFGT